MTEAAEARDATAAWLRSFLAESDFLARYPFYAAVLARLVPVHDPGVSSMGVSMHGDAYYLHVNVDYFVTRPQYLRGVLLHEVHHVALGHLSHPKFRAVAHPELMELAMEVSANEYIDEPLPDPLTWRHFEAAGVRPGQSTLERYEALVRARLAGGLTAPPGVRLVDDHGAGGGWGLRAGEPEPPSGALEKTRALLETALREGKRTSRALNQKGGRLAGRSPDAVLEALDTPDDDAPLVDWRTALRMFVAQARAPRHVYGRPNRRFPQRVFEVPGRAFTSRSHEKLSLLVAIDTSLSMSAGELRDIAGELRPLREHARLAIVECDLTIRRAYPFEGAVREVLGRGGTDLRPVFSPAFYAPFRPDGIVYFTDGEGPYPKDEPRIKTLWVLTKPGLFPCPWGAKARMERDRRP